MSELSHLDLRKLTNDEAITYTSEVCETIHLFPTLEKSMEKVALSFGSAVTLAVGSAVKVDISNLVSSKNEKNKIRGDSYLFFRGIVSSAVRSSDLAEQQAANLLVSTLKLHDWTMQSLPADKFSSKLKAIIKALESPNLKAALVTIGADKAFAKLVAAHLQYDAAEKLCVDARAVHNEVSPSEAIRLVYDEYSKMNAAINGLILTSDDPLIKDMVARLNVLTEAKIQTIKAKATRAENAKKEAKEMGKDKPVVKKLGKKAAKRSVQMPDDAQQPVEEPTDEQLVEQQFMVDQPATEPSAGEQEVDTKTLNDVNDVV
jgi:phosphohistidine phosphatase SixA